MKYLWIGYIKIYTADNDKIKVPISAHVIDEEGNYKKFDMLENPTAVWEYLRGEEVMAHYSHPKHLSSLAKKYNITFKDTLIGYLEKVLKALCSDKNCEVKIDVPNLTRDLGRSGRYFTNTYDEFGVKPLLSNYGRELDPEDSKRALDPEESAYYLWYTLKMSPKYPFGIFIDEYYPYKVLKMWFDGNWHYEVVEEAVKKKKMTIKEKLEVYDMKGVTLKQMSQNYGEMVLRFSPNKRCIIRIFEQVPHITLIKELVPELGDRNDVKLIDIENISFKALWENREKVAKQIKQLLKMEINDGDKITIRNLFGNLFVGVKMHLPVSGEKESYNSLILKEKKDRKKVAKKMREIVSGECFMYHGALNEAQEVDRK